MQEFTVQNDLSVWAAIAIVFGVVLSGMALAALFTSRIGAPTTRSRLLTPSTAPSCHEPERRRGAMAVAGQATRSFEDLECGARARRGYSSASCRGFG